jgi:hypothetical protein
MATHASLGAKLLRDAASFFANVAEQNPELHEQMTSNAATFHRVAELMDSDPDFQFDEAPGPDMPERRITAIAAKLLADAARFFEIVGDSNEPIREQMYDNASVYRQLAQRVHDEPGGEVADAD